MHPGSQEFTSPRGEKTSILKLDINAMKMKSFQRALIISPILLFASCSSTRMASRVLDWDESLVKGPVRLAFVSGPTALNEIDGVDIFDPQEHVLIFARIADTSGNLFRLPNDIRAQWTLMGSDDKDPFYMDGYDEVSDRGNAVQIVSIRKGYAEGQYLYLIPFRPKSGVSYGLRVSVPLGRELVLDEFIPLKLRFF